MRAVARRYGEEALKHLAMMVTKSLALPRPGTRKAGVELTSKSSHPAK